jgi:hypothetical protein
MATYNAITKENNVENSNAAISGVGAIEAIA